MRILCEIIPLLETQPCLYSRDVAIAGCVCFCRLWTSANQSLPASIMPVTAVVNDICMYAYVLFTNTLKRAMSHSTCTVCSMRFCRRVFCRQTHSDHACSFLLSVRLFLVIIHYYASLPSRVIELCDFGLDRMVLLVHVVDVQLHVCFVSLKISVAKCWKNLYVDNVHLWIGFLGSGCNYDLTYDSKIRFNRNSTALRPFDGLHHARWLLHCGLGK